MQSPRDGADRPSSEGGATFALALAAGFFVALVFGMWLWGAIGGIVALPIAIWAMVMHDERRLSIRRLPDSAVAAATEAPQAASARGTSENQTRR